MQIQMFWNPCNKIYNFHYMHMFIFCLCFNLGKRLGFIDYIYSRSSTQYMYLIFGW